jgi:hypothetical protein
LLLEFAGTFLMITRVGILPYVVNMGRRKLFSNQGHPSKTKNVSYPGERRKAWTNFTDKIIVEGKLNQG